MSKYLLIAGAVLALTTAASAEKDHHAKKGHAPKGGHEVHCAVMKEHKISVDEATKKKAYADYKGNRYYFCCAGCAPTFKKNPAKYAKNDHLPTPKK